MNKPLTFFFKDDGLVPNNPALPALVYKSAIDVGSASAPEAEIERLFVANGWGRDMWRDGIFSYVHYHSMIHEALGVARGHARVQLGGHAGEVLEFSAGDIAVLPAGTGHQRLSASNDFSVVGAYPPEGTYDLCRGDNPGEREKALTTIPNVPQPQSDPVFGEHGPLLALWRR
ncbi:MAG TPA: hypothetical protein VFS63_08700 [Pseudolabrys sp.]|nr:hypothetical protein [Pseudolabrys sp.]